MSKTLKCVHVVKPKELDVPFCQDFLDVLENLFPLNPKEFVIGDEYSLGKIDGAALIRPSLRTFFNDLSYKARMYGQIRVTIKEHIDDVHEDDIL